MTVPHLRDSELWRLVYWSRNAVRTDADSGLVADELMAILSSARRNNPRLDVTGALLFNRGAFAQVLEGPRDGIIEIFERIQCDPRHTEVVVLDYAPVGSRRFGEWSMAYLGPEDAEALFPAEFSDRGRGLVDSLNSERVLGAIRTALQDRASV